MRCAKSSIPIRKAVGSARGEPLFSPFTSLSGGFRFWHAEHLAQKLATRGFLADKIDIFDTSATLQRHFSTKLALQGKRRFENLSGYDKDLKGDGLMVFEPHLTHGEPIKERF